MTVTDIIKAPLFQSKTLIYRLVVIPNSSYKAGEGVGSAVVKTFEESACGAL